MDSSKDYMIELMGKVATLELIYSKIYLLFSRLYPDDSKLWWDLSMEETQHASIAEAGMKFIPSGNFPIDFIKLSIGLIEKEVEENNLLLKSLKEGSQKSTQVEAFEIALNIEKQNVEYIYQELMDREAKNTAEKIFQELNKDSADHIIKINKYIDSLSPNRQGGGSSAT